MSIGNNVRNCRMALDWSQHDLAKKAGITQAQISRIEAGGGENVTIRTLRGIAKAFGCSVVELLPENDRRASKSRLPTGAVEAKTVNLEELARRVSELERRLGREVS
jgi:transcriptional regulator with XRE-family HTH domain